jgi:hypothetical protein
MARGLLGKVMTPIQFGWLTKRSLNRVYNRIEEIANDTGCGHACDLPYHQTPSKLIRKDCLDKRIQSLSRIYRNRNLVDLFSDYLCEAADPFVARIRPIPLSERLGCTTKESIELCMRSVENRILDLSWDVICPTCRVASDNVTTLENLASHAHCEACGSDFETDFRDSVEIIFSVQADIRDISRKNWCIGGPFHAPHVLAQNRLQSSQQIDIGLLPETTRSAALKAASPRSLERTKVVLFPEWKCNLGTAMPRHTRRSKQGKPAFACRTARRKS